MTRWEVWSGELQEKEMSDYKKALFDIRIALESSENVSHSEEVGLLLAYTDYSLYNAFYMQP